MEPDELLRLALLEQDHRTLKATVDNIAHDVRLIRDAVLTDAATRRGRGKTLTVIGATLVGAAAFGHDVIAQLQV